jgi:hypothetical protein
MCKTHKLTQAHTHTHTHTHTQENKDTYKRPGHAIKTRTAKKPATFTAHTHKTLLDTFNLPPKRSSVRARPLSSGFFPSIQFSMNVRTVPDTPSSDTFVVIFSASCLCRSFTSDCSSLMISSLSCQRSEKMASSL